MREIYVSILKRVFILPFLILPFFGLWESWVYPNILGELSSQNNIPISAIGQGLFTSLFISLITALISTASGFFLSRKLGNHPKSNNYTLIAYLPLLISPVVFSLIIFYFFLKLGLNGSILGVIIGQLIVLIPYSTILNASFWNPEIKNIEEMMVNMGANIQQKYFKALLPLAKNALLLSLFQTFLISWFDFAIANYIGVGQVKTMTVLVYQFLGEANYFIAAQVACLIIYPLLILLLLNKLIVTGITQIKLNKNND